MFEETIADQNPHWDGRLYKEGVPREALIKAKQYLDLPHTISITGVRRAGKSTLLRQLINHLMKDRGAPPRNILFLNLETPAFSRYRDDVSYLQRIYNDYRKLASPEGSVYCFLDEVHYFREWEVFVKAYYEGKGVKFFVSGSNSRLLSSEFISLLSGRSLTLEVFPFSFTELLRAKGLDAGDPVILVKERHEVRRVLDEYLRHGGFPETTFITEPGLKKDVLVMYARAILYQDIAPRFAIKKAAGLEDLFFHLISNIANMHTYSSLSKLSGLSDKTVKEYLSYYADAYLLFTVDAFDYSVKKQINSPKKIYAIDNGMANCVSFRFSENAGRLLENLVYLKLKKEGRELFYYKTANGLEVDFVCRENKKITELIQVAKEIKSEDTKNRELKAAIKAMDETGLNKAIIVTYEDEGEVKTNGKTVEIVPAYKYLVDIEQ